MRPSLLFACVLGVLLGLCAAAPTAQAAAPIASLSLRLRGSASAATGSLLERERLMQPELQAHAEAHADTDTDTDTDTDADADADADEPLLELELQGDSEAEAEAEAEADGAAAGGEDQSLLEAEAEAEAEAAAASVVAGQAANAPAAPAAPAKLACTTELSPGCKGPAVLALQKLLVKLKLLPAASQTSVYDPATRAAVQAFQKSKRLTAPAGREGHAGPTTLKFLQQASQQPPQAALGSGGGQISAAGRQQMANLLAYAKANNAGPYEYRGRCFAFVWKYLMGMKGPYGKISAQFNPPESEMKSNYARYFADFFNVPANAAKYGLQKLNIKNAYDAPPGSIVVVGPGTPGTAHPVAGDIAVSSDEPMGSGSHGYAGCTNCHYFINDASRMNYGDPKQFPARGNLLGVFAPL